jgi:proteasome accessory factor C
MSAPPAQDRLARLLAIVPWVAATDGPAISEVCERFGVSERDLMADLDLLFLCGVHPFTPDTLIEVDVADGRVWIRFADYFRRPLRLTAPEGLALLGAGAALDAIPGGVPDGALSRALAKLEDVLGMSRDEALDVTLGAAPPAVLEALRQASAGRHKVDVDYYSSGRDGRSRRVIHPWRVHNTAGQWYAAGWCELAGAERLFRVDRIRSAQVLDDTFDTPEQSRPGGVGDLYHPRPDDAVVVLDLAPSARWVAEQYPNEGVELRPDGRLRVRLRTGQRAWLERLLLRAGSETVVVEGDVAVRTGAAERILARYRS